MSYDMKKSGKRIRHLRIENNLTQEQVATTLNIDQGFYARIEGGKKGCSVDLFIQISALFNVSLDYLILGRCLGDLPKRADIAQLKTDIGELMAQLEMFKMSI